MIKDYIADDVGSLVAPVGNNGFTTVLEFNHLLPMVLVLGRLLDLIHLVEAGLCRHELKDRVHAKHRSHSAANSSGLEPTPNLNSSLLQFDRVRGIEESRSFTDLLEVSLPESLLDDDVQECVHHSLTFVVLGLFSQVNFNLRSLVDVDILVLALKDTLEVHRSLNFSKSINTLSRIDKRSKSRFHLTTLTTDDSVSTVSVPEFHRLNLKGILEDLKLRTELHSVLIAYYRTRFSSIGMLG